jgi:hypothetical protein
MEKKNRNVEYNDDIKFAVDCMLGKLAKTLRMMGFDTFYESYIDDADLVDIAYRENRIILTRDVDLTNRKKAEQFLWIKSTNHKEQIKQVINEFNLNDKKKPLSRCLVCNEQLNPIDKEEVEDIVPEYTYKTQNEFYKCSGCGKIYWPATHVESMKDIYDID